MWVGDAVVPTGFARVTHSIIDRLKDKYEFHVIGVNYWGDPHGYEFSIYPAVYNNQLEPYGYERVPDLVEKIKPDILVLFNDPWILDSYLRTLKKSKVDLEKLKIVAYFPVDSENIDPRFFGDFDIVDVVCTYTEFGKEQFLRSFGRLTDTKKEVSIIPHGVDLKKFHPYERVLEQSATAVAREKLLGEKHKDAFIVFNGNRNSPRKRFDIFLHAFRIFAEDKEDVRVYCHTGLVDQGIDIIRFCVDYNIKDKLIVTTTSNSTPGVTDEDLNTIFNAVDVGVNTSMGEGWGLVSFEHAATMTPQIVPNHSACRELWQDIGIIYDVIDQPAHITPRLNCEFKVPDVYKLVEAFNYAYNDWKNGGKELKNLAKKAYKTISKYNYSWDYAADRFDEIFRNIL